MKNLLRAIPLLFVFLSFLNGAFGQAQLNSVYKNKFYTQSVNYPMQVTIYGKNIWPDYMDNNGMISRVKVFFRKGDKVQEIRKISSNASQTTVSFLSDDWLRTTTPVEVYLETDGKRSNSLAITVVESPKTPPVINNISPSKFAVGQPSDKYSFRISASNLGEEGSTSVTVNGIPATVAWQNLIEGVIDVWIPKSLINTPGTYNVKTRTKMGESNPVPLTIEQPFVKMVPISPIQGAKPSNVKVINKDVTASKVNAIKPINAAAIDPSMKLLSGIRVKMIGLIKYAEDKSVLENYIRELDRVMFVENELAPGDNNQNLFISIKGTNVERVTLDHVKLSIQKKLSEMGITAQVNIE